jgi:hypothetical protein
MMMSRELGAQKCFEAWGAGGDVRVGGWTTRDGGDGLGEWRGCNNDISQHLAAWHVEMELLRRAVLGR